MNLNDIGITESQLLLFFKNVSVVTSNLGNDRIEYKSKEYPTLTILNHKGYIYLWEEDEKNKLKYQNYFIDGFRCMPSRSDKNLIYLEIHASGDTGISNTKSFEIDLPENVINYLLDALKPHFLENDIF